MITGVKIVLFCPSLQTSALGGLCGEFVNFSQGGLTLPARANHLPCYRSDRLARLDQVTAINWSVDDHMINRAVTAHYFLVYRPCLSRQSGPGDGLGGGFSCGINCGFSGGFSGGFSSG